MNALQTWKIWVLAAIMSLGILTASVAVMPQFATADEGSSTATTESASSSEAGSAPTTKETSSSTQSEAVASSSTQSKGAASSSAKSENEESSSSTETSAEASKSAAPKAFTPNVAEGVDNDQQVEGSPLVVDEETVVEESQVWTGGMVRIVDGGSIVIPAGVELTLDSVTVDLSGFDADGYCFVVKRGGKLILTGTTQISGFSAEPSDEEAEDEAEANAEAEAESSSSSSKAAAKTTASGIVKVQQKGALMLADQAALIDNTSTAKGSDLILTGGEVALAGDDINLANNTTDPKKEGEADTPEEIVTKTSTGTIVRMPALMADTPDPNADPSGSETTTVNGAVTWTGDTESTRPSELKIQLLDKDGKAVEGVDPATATKDGEWKYEFANVPKPAEGEAYTVKVTSTLPEGYTATVDGMNVAVAYEAPKPATVTKTVKLVWNDFQNKSGKRPDFVTVKLLSDTSEVVAEIPISDADKKKDEITYDVPVEEGVTYDKIALEGEFLAGYKVTPNHDKLELVFDRASMLIKKTWKPEKDPKGNRGPVVVKLKFGSEEKLIALSEKELSDTEKKKLEDANKPKTVEMDCWKESWVALVTDLDYCKAVEKDGKTTYEVISYTVEEDQVAGYMKPEYNADLTADPLKSLAEKYGAVYGCEIINKIEGSSNVTVSTSTIKATGTGKGLASTGDSTNFLLVAFVLLGSIAAAGFALTRRRTE